MIIVIDAFNRDRFEGLLDEMFQLRARVFGDRLGWEVDIQDGREVDQFDALDPAYLVGLDDDGQVVSCVRLLQTTGPHMLPDVFASILDGEPPLRSSHVWEASRFCVDTQRLKAKGDASGISRATSEIILGINDYGMRAGITDIVAVIDPIMNRVLKRSACAPYDYVGSEKPMGKVRALAALLDCTEERGGSVRAFSGIEGSIFIGDEAAAALLDRAAPAEEPMDGPQDEPAVADNVVPFPTPKPVEATEVTTADMLSYCIEMIRSAEDEEERVRALGIARHLLKGTRMADDVALLARALDVPVEAVAH